jgi:2-polyprenyl-3-methyl-5-hydroxy-6-metoxy-1,4-benzoquinol methylase
VRSNRSVDSLAREIMETKTVSFWVPGGTRAAGLSRRSVRRLRSSATGRFRTRGRNSSATVRGTIWTTTDRCDGTLTTVKRGKVDVRDFRRKKTILVRAGKSYLAKAPG